MGFLSKILIFFGRTDKNKFIDGKSVKEIEEEVLQSIREFNNRPIYTQLTEKIIDNTSDDDLLQVVFDNLSQKQAEDFEDEYEIVSSWNDSRQAIYMIWLLEGEVNNGGYNQFYENSNGQFYNDLPDALKLVGANGFAKLMQRANETFQKENRQITQHQDGTVEGFIKSYENNPLNQLDDEFYDLYKKEDLQQIQINFIRKHKTDFIDL